LLRLDVPLERTARRLASSQIVVIVALGSSSTAGAGASSDAASYPSRLAMELSRYFPSQPITVLNRGVNGELAVDMLARFDRTVAAEHPDLVLWQLGTNAILRGHERWPSSSLIRDGNDLGRAWCVPRTSSGVLGVRPGNIGDEGRQE
jgi:acyl-CoA thioesterase-1